MILKGVDISTWDTDIDWDNLSSSTDFVIIRSSFGTQGTGDVDNRFFEHINNAKSHGVNTGVYHYIYAKDEDEARREARFCLDTIKGYKLEYPVALDIEDASLEDLDSDTLTNICKAFCSEIEKPDIM